jgi:hypothetical protein
VTTGFGPQGTVELLLVSQEGSTRGRPGSRRGLSKSTKAHAPRAGPLLPLPAGVETAGGLADPGGIASSSRAASTRPAWSSVELSDGSPGLKDSSPRGVEADVAVPTRGEAKYGFGVGLSPLELLCILPGRSGVVLYFRRHVMCTPSKGNKTCFFIHIQNENIFTPAFRSLESRILTALKGRNDANVVCSKHS